MGYSARFRTCHSNMETLDGLAISGPMYLITATQACNLCGKENTIAALATKGLIDPDEPQEEGDGYLLSYVEDLPADVLDAVRKRHPNFEIRHSLTAESDYFMTICECGGHYGDHYVQKQILNQAFRAPSELKVEKLFDSGNWTIPCGYSQSLEVGDLLDETVNR